MVEQVSLLPGGAGASIAPASPSDASSLQVPAQCKLLQATAFALIQGTHASANACLTPQDKPVSLSRLCLHREVSRWNVQWQPLCHTGAGQGASVLHRF